MKLFRILTIGLTCAASFAAGAAEAAAFIYSQGRNEIKACQLVLPSMNYGNASADYNGGLIGILNTRLDLKPAGWDFVNPLASPQVTPAIQNRWAFYQPAPVLGAYVTKDDPWYWDVELANVTLSRLLQFELIYLCLPQTGVHSLTIEQREILRKLVDSGAQLWIDSSRGSFVNNNCGFDSFFLPGFSFQNSTRGPAFVNYRQHPLLSHPFYLLQSEINLLGRSDAAAVVNLAGPPATSVLAPVVSNGGSGGNALVAAGSYGSGHIILTSNNVGGDIVRFRGGGFAAPEDLKFAYNVVAWGSNYTTTFKGPSHNSYSQSGPGAPLVLRWAYNAAPPAADSAAIMYKGVVFYSTADGRVLAFDGVPQQDLNGDGSPDDGVQDFSTGIPYDGLYEVNIGGNISGPTIFQSPGGAIPAGTDVIMVQTANGDVIAFEAFPAGFASAPSPVTLMTGLGQHSASVPSPTYHNGVVYAAGGDNGTAGGVDSGILWGYDIAANASFRVPESQAGSITLNYAIGALPASPTVGWTQDIGSGALDLMAYWLGTSAPGVIQNDRAFAAIFAVRNEPLNRLSNVIAATRYNFARNYLPDYNIWSFPGVGLCSNLQPFIDVSAPAAGQFKLLTTSAAATDSSDPIFADYNIARSDADLSAPSTASADFRPRNVFSPNPQYQATGGAPQLRYTATPAMGPDGTLYLVGKRGNASQLSAINEFGQRFNVTAGQERVPEKTMDWTYWFGAIPAAGYAPAKDFVGETSKPVNPDDPFVGTAFGDMEVVGPPAVTADAVYVSAKGSGGAALFAFTRKQSFQIVIDPSVNMFDANNRPLPIRIYQSDPFAAIQSLTPLQDSARVPSSALDYGRRTITINNFDGEFEVGPSNARRPIFAGLPIIVYVGDVSVPIDTTAMTNLRWYMIPHDDTTRIALNDITPPSVLGDHVFFGANNRIFAVRTDAAPDLGKQVLDIQPLYMNNQDWALRANPVEWSERIATGNIANPVSGAGGMLAVLTSTGIQLFDSPATMIADANRLVELDAGSRAVWSLNNTTDTNYAGMTPNNPTGLSQKKTNFARPSVVRSVEGNSLLIADTGNDRVVRADRAGNIQWEIRDFIDPLNLLSSGEPLSLKSPSDVRFWQGIETDPILGVPAFVYHYLVVDRDNFRVLDLIVRFDANGNPLPVSTEPADALTILDKAPTVLNWVSPTRRDGRLLRYETAMIFPNAAPAATTQYQVLAAVSNFSLTADAPADPFGGGIVAIDYMEITSGNPTRNYVRPAVIGGVAPNINYNGQLKKLASPRSFERYWVGGGSFNDIICDNEGVWILNDTGTVIWSLTSNQYQNSLPDVNLGGGIRRGVPLRANAAKVLANGRVLIANGFTGLNVCGNEFRGEVFEVDRVDQSNNPLTSPIGIYWSAPRVEPALCPDGSTPSYRQTVTGSYLIEQPTFVDRR